MKARIMGDNGVSEVIGVMLMISVTLIIVALVAVFASNTGIGADRSIQADLVASGVMMQDSGYWVIFDHRSGDSFSVDRLEVSIGSRERQELHIQLRNDFEQTRIESLVSGATIIQLGDRFVVRLGDYDPANQQVILSRDPLTSLSFGEHLTYRFIDRQTGMPVSSGEMAVRRSQ